MTIILHKLPWIIQNQTWYQTKKTVWRTSKKVHENAHENERKDIWVLVIQQVWHSSTNCCIQTTKIPSSRFVINSVPIPVSQTGPLGVFLHSLTISVSEWISIAQKAIRIAFHNSQLQKINLQKFQSYDRRCVCSKHWKPNTVKKQPPNNLSKQTLETKQTKRNKINN